MNVVLGLLCLQLCLAPVWTDGVSDSQTAASNKDKRDASLLSQGYPVQHQQHQQQQQHQHQVSVIPSVEVAAGSYYEQEPAYGTPAVDGQHQILHSEQQQAFYGGQTTTNYGGPLSSYQPTNEGVDVGGQYSSDQPQQQRYVQGGTYGPPTAVLFQGIDDTNQVAQSNHAVASVRQLDTPHYTQSSYSSPAVQNVQIPSGSYGAPVVGASLNFAAPSHTTGQGVYAGYVQAAGQSYSVTPNQVVHSYAAPSAHGGHSYSTAPAPVYGVPQYTRQQPQQSHRVAAAYSSGLRPQSQSFGKTQLYNNQYVHHSAPQQQSYHRTHATPPSPYTQITTHSYPTQSRFPAVHHHQPQSYQSYQPPTYKPTGHASVIDDGYGNGPSYATGAKGLGHYSSSASHSSPSYTHAPSHVAHQSSYRPKTYYAKSAAFKPSAYLGSTDLSSTSQSRTFVLPSDHSVASTPAGHQAQSYNTIRYSAV